MRALIGVFLLSAACLEPADLVLTGGTLYPSPDARPVPSAVIVVRRGRIAAVGPHGSVRVANGVPALDCSGRFIVAGFWNSHVHLFTPALLHAREAASAELNAQLDAMLNRWGFTTAFDTGSVLENTLEIRRRIRRGEVRGPRILTTGEPLWTAVPVYVRDFLAANRLSMPAVSTPGEAARRVGAQAAAGAGGIKLFTGSLQAGGRVANMPVEIVRAAVSEAHRRGLPVFAHPQNAAGLEAAISGGVDVLAHTAPQSPPWTPEFAARSKQARLALIPTLTLFDFEAAKTNLAESARQAWTAKMIAELRAFSSAGGQVLFGTDIGYTDRFDTAMEFESMSRAGMSFAQVLASLTTSPAARFGRAAHSGRVEKGMDADLVVLADDPAKSIAALSRVRHTIRGGRIIYPAR